MKHPILAAATVGAALAAAPEAMAQSAVRLEATGSAENFVEWTGAHGSNVVASNIHGRVISVTATTNAPIELEGACPPPSSYPGWQLATEAAPTDGSDHAEVDADSVARTGENGTFSLRLTAPSRVGQALKADVSCIRGTQRETLTAEIMSVGSGSSGSDFLYRGPIPVEEKETGKSPVYVGVAAANIMAVTGEAAKGSRPGLIAKIGVNAGSDIAVEGVFRTGAVAEFARDPSGSEASRQKVDRTVHGGFIMGGYHPEFIPDTLGCNFDAGVGLSGSPVARLKSPYVPNGHAIVREVSAAVTGRIAASCWAGSPNFPAKLEIGADYVFQPSHDVLNSAAFPFGGINVQF